MTSSALLEMFRPERPCWKPMFLSFRGAAGGTGGSGNGLDLAVRDGGSVGQFEVECAVVGVDGADRAAHHRRGRDSLAVGGGRHLELQAAGGRACWRRQLETLTAGGLARLGEGVDDGARGTDNT